MTESPSSAQSVARKSSAAAQTGRYIAIGVMNTIAGYAIFIFIFKIIGETTNYLTVSTLAHILSVTFSFVTHRTIVFKSKAQIIPEYLRFHCTHIGSLIIGLAILWALKNTFIKETMTAQAVAMTVTAIASYFAHKKITFRQK